MKNAIASIGVAAAMVLSYLAVVSFVPANDAETDIDQIFSPGDA